MRGDLILLAEQLDVLARGEEYLESARASSSSRAVHGGSRSRRVRVPASGDTGTRGVASSSSSSDSPVGSRVEPADQPGVPLKAESELSQAPPLCRFDSKCIVRINRSRRRM